MIEINQIQDFKINLQFFAGEKTEKATPRRKREARRKGQVVKSNEVITVLLLTFVLLVLKFWLPYIWQDFRIFFTHVFTYTKIEFTINTAVILLLEMITVTAKMAAPILFIAMIAGYTANVLQIGFLFTAEPLKIDLKLIERVQKREFVRVGLVLEVLLSYFNSLGEEEVIRCQSRDISGGGMMLVLKNYVPLKKGYKIKAQFMLDKTLIKTPAIIVWNDWELDSEGIERNLIGIKFTNIAETDRKIIIKSVYKRQIELKRKGLF